MPTAVLKLEHGAIHWWKPSQDKENLGDFLSRYLLERLFSGTRVSGGVYFLIGSVITRGRIEALSQSMPALANPRVVFWCCGCRDESGLPPAVRAHAAILGARGPLTAGVLGLPPETPLGDPAFLLPLVYTPRPAVRTSGKTVFIPHVYEALKLSEQDMCQRSEADTVLTPLIGSTFGDVEQFIDQLCAAEFVLTSSLHGAIIACAYGVPFSFFDCGFVDIPFKWRDFSASIGIGTYFPRTVEDARTVYERLMKGRIRRPPLVPLLEIAPFAPRTAVMSRAIEYDRTPISGWPRGES